MSLHSTQQPTLSTGQPRTTKGEPRSSRSEELANRDDEKKRYKVTGGHSSVSSKFEVQTFCFFLKRNFAKMEEASELKLLDKIESKLHPS